MAGAERQGDVFDLERLGQLIELMKEHGLTEVDLQQDEQKIRLSCAVLGCGERPTTTCHASAGRDHERDSASRRWPPYRHD